LVYDIADNCPLNTELDAEFTSMMLGPSQINAFNQLVDNPDPIGSITVS